MRFLPVLALCVGSFFISCSSDPDLPTCIQERLDVFETDPTVCSATAGNPLAAGNLALFRFRTEEVYCFNWGACNPNKTIEIWTADCELLCELGGPNGLVVCDGTPWEGNAQELDEIYRR